MTAEDQDILAKISQLAGQINRHKNQQHVVPSSTSSQSRTISPIGSKICRVSKKTGSLDLIRADGLGDAPRANVGSNHPRGAYSGRGRGFSRGVRSHQIHRNRSLVLNGATTITSTPDVTTTTTSNENSVQGQTSSVTVASSSWVTKSDRHLQLINPAIYDKETQQRAKAIEETRKLRLKQRDERERLKVTKHLHRLGRDDTLNSTRGSMVAPAHEIVVQGIRFRVMKNGSKLIKIPGDDNAAKATPKTAAIGGVMFYRSKNGNLYRSGIVKAQRYDPKARRATVKKINEPCKAFSTTGTCVKGPRCRYIHDPSKVAVCKEYLQKGTCQSGDTCDLSHDPTPERTPTCLHFAKGNCSNPNCRYAHVRVAPGAPVCRAFGIYGYCEKGADCSDRHVNECPDYSNTGMCTTKGCKLLHRDKASVIRKNTSRGEQKDEDGSSDLSSEEDQDEIGSDDVDSDELDEEYFGNEDGQKDPGLQMQQDFVQFR